MSKDKQNTPLNYVWVMPSGLRLGPVQNTLLPLVSETSVAIGEGFDACASILNSSHSHADRQTAILRLLLDSCHLTSESVLILIGNVKLWDADILMRSVAEGTMKFSYLAFGSREEVEQKVHEYDDVMPASTQLKRHDRLSQFLSVVNNPNADEWRPYRDLLLNQQDERNIRDQHPKVMRKEVERKWSFHGLLQSLSDSNIRLFKDFIHLFYNYGMSSHVLHQDSDGIGMIWERNNRSEVRRNAVEIAHGCRILSDLMAMSTVKHAMASHLSGQSEKEAMLLYRKHGAVHQVIKEHLQRWNVIEYENNPTETGAKAQ